VSQKCKRKIIKLRGPKLLPTKIITSSGIMTSSINEKHLSQPMFWIAAISLLPTLQFCVMLTKMEMKNIVVFADYHN
jgi:hypothetical protein